MKIFLFSFQGALFASKYIIRGGKQVDDNQFYNEIQKLVDGVISEIIVEKEMFLTFRNAWLASEHRQSIVGEAGLSGKVIYRLVKLNK